MFLDYRNADGFTDDFSIIYGHRMTDYLMFGDVKLFVDKEYFDAHESGELRVSDELYILRVLGFITISANSAIYNLREYQNDRNAQIVEQFKKLATNWRDVYRGGKLLLLSTCNENARKYRDVLLLEVLK